jgi:TorA maturation chaperone TorD
MNAPLHSPPATQDRASSYALLAALVASPLSTDQIDTLRKTGAGLEHAGLARDLLAALAEPADLAEAQLELARDHARLFSAIAEGYGPRPPFASLWLTGQMMGPATTDIASLFETFGFRPTLSGPCDHIATLLDFMGALALSAPPEAQTETLDRYLLTWIGPWAQAVKADASTDFYRALMQTIHDFLRADRATLEAAPCLA